MQNLCFAYSVLFCIVTNQHDSATNLCTFPDSHKVPFTNPFIFYFVNYTVFDAGLKTVEKNIFLQLFMFQVLYYLPTYSF